MGTGDTAKKPSARADEETLAADQSLPSDQSSFARQVPIGIGLSINPYGFAFGVAGIVLLTKAASFLTPYKLYFTFSSFLYGDTNVFRWESLVIKLVIPVLIGFLLYYLPFHWMRITRGSNVSHRTLYRYLSRQSQLTAKMTGFFGALLMAWPIIVYWDIVVSPDRIGLKLPFLFAYILYFIGYAYFADLGVVLAKLLLQASLPKAATVGISGRVSRLESIRTSLMGIITSGIATYFASRLGTPP